MLKRDWALIGLLSILWGAAYFTAKIAVQELSVLGVVATRFLLAGTALFLFLRMFGIAIPRNRQAWAAFTVMGVFNSLLPGLLVTWAQKSIPSGLASIIVSSTPLFALGLDTWVTKERQFNIMYLAGTLIAILGLSFVVGWEVPQASRETLLAVLACFAAAAAYAYANVYGRGFRSRGIEPKIVAFGQIAVTAALATPLAVVFNTPGELQWPSLRVVTAMLGLSLVSTAAGYILFFHILAGRGGKNVSLVTLLIPVSATILGALALGERLSGIQLLGMATLIAGLLLVNRADALRE
jgi:drug/metabolite transporter (DMT)-like permease